MSWPAEGPLPVIDLNPGATITITAVDPTTGLQVAGVIFSAGIIYGEGGGGDDGDAPIDSMFLLPTGT